MIICIPIVLTLIFLFITWIRFCKLSNEAGDFDLSPVKAVGWLVPIPFIWIAYGIYITFFFH